MLKILFQIFLLFSINFSVDAAIIELPINTTTDDQKNVEFTTTVGNNIKFSVNYWLDFDNHVWRLKIEELTDLGDRYVYVDEEEIIADKIYLTEQSIDVGRILVSDESGKHQNPTEKNGDLGGRVKLYHLDKREIITSFCNSYPLKPKIGQDESLIKMGCLGAAKLKGENANGKVYLIDDKIISVTKGKIVRWISAP